MNNKLTHFDPTKQPILVTVAELATMLNLGRTATWELVRQHKIKSIKIGRTRRVPVAAIQEYIDRLLESEVA
jgi:excisionase family DNA binding protein